MWRLSVVSAKPCFVSASVTLNTPVAYPLDDNDESLVQAEATLADGVIATAHYDTSTEEQQLNDIYNDIKNNKFPLLANDTLALLKKYPQFDVNLKSTISNHTMLHKAIYLSTPRVAKALIDHPLMTKNTLEDCLAYLNNYIKINKTQLKIKEYIENALGLKSSQMPGNVTQVIENAKNKQLFIKAVNVSCYSMVKTLINANKLSNEDYQECLDYVLNKPIHTINNVITHERILTFMIEHMSRSVEPAPSHIVYDISGEYYEQSAPPIHEEISV